ncbi:MAG: hypothetical protein V3V86_02845, partial [Gammaproteobacteria bacterium]
AKAPIAISMASRARNVPDMHRGFNGVGIRHILLAEAALSTDCAIRWDSTVSLQQLRNLKISRIGFSEASRLFIGRPP